MAIILTESAEDAKRYEFSLGEKAIVTNTEYGLKEAVSENPAERLIIVGADIKLDLACRVAEGYRLERPELGVVLVRKRLEINVLTDALRAGIREVVSNDDAGALVAACKRSNLVSEQLIDGGRNPEAFKQSGKVVIVFSAKGGCGKTTVAVNLAHALSENRGAKVALLDFDLQFGDVAIALQIDPVKTISDAIGMQHNLDELGIQSLMVHQTENLDILLAPTNPTDVEFISGDFIADLITKLRQKYDYIVVDSPPAFTDVVLRVFDIADRAVLLSTLDMPAIKNLKLVMSTLEALKVPSRRLEYALNRSDVRAGITVADVEQIIGQKFTTLIPSSNDVPASTNRGVPLVMENPRHPVSREIINLARRIDELLRPTSVVKKKSFGASLFSRSK